MKMMTVSYSDPRKQRQKKMVYEQQSCSVLLKWDKAYIGGLNASLLYFPLNRKGLFQKIIPKIKPLLLLYTL